MIGIYKIENKVNGKVYIGQSVNIDTRWYNHRNELNGNRHHNEHLQNAWNKYGSNSFDFILIEECTLENIDEREIFWIKHFNSLNPNFGYNLTAGGQGMHGYSWSEEMKEHFSKMRNPNAILQLDLNGKILERWRSGSYAARETGIPVSGIMNCVRDDGDQYQSHGYIWIYEYVYYDKKFNIDDYIEEHIAERPKIIEYNLYGNVLKVWNNAVEIRKHYGKNSVIYKSLTCVLNHDRRSVRGKIFLYENDDFQLTDEYLRDVRIKSAVYKINQFDVSKKFIKTWTQDELKESDFLFDSIRHYCTQAYVGNFINKPLYKYIWEYE